MDGKTLLRWFLDMLGEADFYGDYSSERKAYECMDWAAAIFCREAVPLALTVDITTVLDQQDYPLPPGFIAFLQLSPLYVPTMCYSHILQPPPAQTFRLPLLPHRLRYRVGYDDYLRHMQVRPTLSNMSQRQA